MSETQPVIGIIACERTVEGEPAQAVKHRYIEAVAQYAGAVPLLVASNQPTANVPALVERLDALVLTGSNSNIAPTLYGSQAPAREPVDTRRDTFAAALIEVAIASATPVLGICRGLQEINVALGGTLRDLRDGALGTRHHAPEGVALDTMFAHAHPVAVEEGSLFARIAGGGPFEVNSVHYQAVERLGAGLAVGARSADGVIEAIHATGTPAPVLAVQWHPEWRPQGRPHDLALWSWLADTARARRPGAAAVRAWA